MPTIFFFFLFVAVDDDADGKQIVDLFKVEVLFLHLIPDGEYRFGTAFYFKFKAVSG